MLNSATSINGLWSTASSASIFETERVCFAPNAGSRFASEILDLFARGSFSFWHWVPSTNVLTTHGELTADSLEDWILRIHPRDQAEFSRFIDQEWTGDFPAPSIEYRFNANRQGDWIRLRHTASLNQRGHKPMLSCLLEREISSNPDAELVYYPTHALIEESLKGSTILLVEDEAAVRKLVRKLLETLGCSVIEAISGRHALELWPDISDCVDLVVSDIVMPDGVSGWELARELHHRHPALGILLTSGFDQLPKDHGLDHLPQIAFLQKPYGVKKLKSTLVRLIELSATVGEHLKKAQSR